MDILNRAGSMINFMSIIALHLNNWIKPMSFLAI